MAAFLPLAQSSLESILRRIPHLTVGVIGDLFLDRYLDLDAALTEPSLETGLDAYQVVSVRSNPGAAGTVINNLVSLGIGRIFPIAVIGDDGEGYELRQALDRQRVVDLAGLLIAEECRTPTYTKPMLRQADAPPRELNRLDIKNRRPLPRALEERIHRQVREIWPQVDAVVVLDQVSEPDCGVVTASVRALLAELASADSSKFVLADSRKRIGLFRGVSLKPNRREALHAAGFAQSDADDVLERAAIELARQAGRWVFCTDGARGTLVASAPDGAAGSTTRIAACPVDGPLDIVGAGDSTSAGIVCAMASGASAEDAACLGNLVASITIQQLSTTGTATRAQVRQRFAEGK
jgi:rfaE bifunctional protein kinase chain/domain